MLSRSRRLRHQNRCLTHPTLGCPAFGRYLHCYWSLREHLFILYCINLLSLLRSPSPHTQYALEVMTSRLASPLFAADFRPGRTMYILISSSRTKLIHVVLYKQTKRILALRFLSPRKPTISFNSKQKNNCRKRS